MKPWPFQVAFGVSLGIALRVLLPGHQTAAGLALTGGLSLAGATMGSGFARVLLPTDLSNRGGFLMAGIGAVAALLLQALFTA